MRWYTHITHIERLGPIKSSKKVSSSREMHEVLQADAERLEKSMTTLVSEIETMNLLITGLWGIYG